MQPPTAREELLQQIDAALARIAAAKAQKGPSAEAEAEERRLEAARVRAERAGP